MSENAKQMQCVNMTGIDLQDLSIEPLCFVQAAGLMVLNGISKHVLNASRSPLWQGPALLVFRPALFAVHLSKVTFDLGSVSWCCPILIRREVYA
jgi:hypothetical protein